MSDSFTHFLGGFVSECDGKDVTRGYSAFNKVNDAVNTIRQGQVWVETSAAVTADSDAYVDVAGGIGKFTSSSSGNLATGGKFRSTTAGAGLAKLEINLP